MPMGAIEAHGKATIDGAQAIADALLSVSDSIDRLAVAVRSAKSE